jgi:hypothetical protein
MPIRQAPQAVQLSLSAGVEAAALWQGLFSRVLPDDGEAVLAPTLLSCLPSLDPETGEVTAVIETPKGS